MTKKAAAADPPADCLADTPTSAEPPLIVEPLQLDPVDAPVCSQMKTKRVVLNDEQEELLLDLLHSNPCIYDKTMRDYKLTVKKESLWQTQANLMGLSKQDVQQWFRTQRTLFGKLSKDGISGEGAKQRTERQQWILQKMQFMGTHFNRQAKPNHPASFRVKLVKKASATLTRADLVSMDSSDEEGEVAAPPVIIRERVCCWDANFPMFNGLSQL